MRGLSHPPSIHPAGLPPSLPSSLSLSFVLSLSTRSLGLSGLRMRLCPGCWQVYVLPSRTAEDVREQDVDSDAPDTHAGHRTRSNSIIGQKRMGTEGVLSRFSPKWPLPIAADALAADDESGPTEEPFSRWVRAGTRNGEQRASTAATAGLSEHGCQEPLAVGGGTVRPAEERILLAIQSLSQSIDEMRVEVREVSARLSRLETAAGYGRREHGPSEDGQGRRSAPAAVTSVTREDEMSRFKDHSPVLRWGVLVGVCLELVVLRLIGASSCATNSSYLRPLLYTSQIRLAGRAPMYERSRLTSSASDQIAWIAGKCPCCAPDR